MDFKNLFQSQKSRKIIYGVGLAIATLLIFQAGVFVGYKKANFSYRWAENYHRNFGGPRGGFFQFLDRDDYMNAHGTFGPVIKIDGNILTVKDQSGAEKIILISDGTEIRMGRDKISSSDLKIDDRIVAIGNPNDKGQVEAKLIRVFR